MKSRRHQYWSFVHFVCFLVLLLALLSSECSCVNNVVPIYKHNFSYVIREPSCPINCTCLPNLKGPILVLDCVRRTTDNYTLLANEIDLLINSISLKLTNLTINNSPLNEVPKSICMAVNLIYLNLTSNKLSMFPQNCFSNLVKLEVLTARHNKLTELQDGLFNGLANLTTLWLANNSISKIGLHTFTHKAGLARLNQIDLEFNNLTSLEPWPFIRGQLVPLSEIWLANNYISEFTNELNWSYRCEMKPLVKMLLNMEFNNVQYIIDLTNGWNITGLLNLLCLFGPSPEGGLKLFFNHNCFVCDCLDYTIYSLVHQFPHINVMNNLFCQSPLNMYNKRIMSVPLEEFVCDIPSPACPDGCRCIKRPYNKTLVVTCNTLRSLPVLLPNTSYPLPYKAKYMLQFRGSFLDTVGYQDYFSETYSVDVSQSSVSNVTDEAWRALVQLPVVDLSGNNLTTLPPILPMLNSTIKSLSLYSNPWRCECGDRWIRDWLVSLGTLLQSPESMLCNSPNHMRTRSILSISDDEFCYDPEREKILITTLQIAVPAVIVIVALTITTALHRWRVEAFVRLGIHPFDVDECEGEEMHYDVYMSFAKEDNEIVEQMVECLEKVSAGEARSLLPGGYRVFYHEREVDYGASIPGIGEEIRYSRRVVCIVTNNFVNSGQCMKEFDEALTLHTEIKKPLRLVLVKLPELDLSAAREKKFANTLERFFLTHKCVDYGSDVWWNQLRYALPKKKSISVEESRETHCVLNEAQSTG